jgi:uncharacterized protein (TIGR02757 family)
MLSNTTKGGFPDILILKDFLDKKVSLYNRKEFIEADPISIPHRYTRKQDIEIAGILSATIAWGNRVSIVRNGQRLMSIMDDRPYEFVMWAAKSDLQRLDKFVHRTFNASDCLFFIESLKQIYTKYGSLEGAFTGFSTNAETSEPGSEPGMVSDSLNAYDAIINFRDEFLKVPHLTRSEKHIANPAKGSSAKRINMFLRWMVRKDNNGVDFGIWNTIRPSQLVCPLDVHSGRTARQFGLLIRPQNDWKAVMELTGNLRLLDPDDPVKYDFALFGSGVDR